MNLTEVLSQDIVKFAMLAVRHDDSRNQGHQLTLETFKRYLGPEPELASKLLEILQRAPDPRYVNLAKAHEEAIRLVAKNVASEIIEWVKTNGNNAELLLEERPTHFRALVRYSGMMAAEHYELGAIAAEAIRLFEAANQDPDYQGPLAADYGTVKTSNPPV